MKLGKILLGLTILLSPAFLHGTTKAQTKTITTKQTKNMNTEVEKSENQTLDTRQQSIVAVSALTATDNPEKLKAALNQSLDSKLTINEIKSILVQMYAYAGFPRSLNGINAFMKVVEERKSKGIKDEEGKTATPIKDGDIYERGRKTLEKITGQPQSKPAPGFGEFAPEIDRYLKEHLFADIFDNDVLTHEQRELATISALAAMSGVESQLQSHLGIGMNVGLKEDQLKSAFDLIEKNIGRKQAETARQTLAKMIAEKKKDQ